VLRRRMCSKCQDDLVRVYALDDIAVEVDYNSGRRGDPRKALEQGKIKYVENPNSPTRIIWRRLTKVTEVECTHCGHRETISPVREIEEATGVKPLPSRSKADQIGFAGRLVKAALYANAHPEVLGNDPNYTPPPLDYSTVMAVMEQVENAEPQGVYFIPR